MTVPATKESSVESASHSPVQLVEYEAVRAPGSEVTMGLHEVKVDDTLPSPNVGPIVPAVSSLDFGLSRTCDQNNEVESNSVTTSSLSKTVNSEPTELAQPSKHASLTLTSYSVLKIPHRYDQR